MQVVTFSDLRNHLKDIMDNSADRHEEVIIKRVQGENMILLSQSDYESLKETAYLLSNEANAHHLRESLKSLKKGKLLKRGLMDE
ncbi:MAG: type II toxin-antitoxin system Phd/YefM family antitoxin [Gammaproteobacteria bacterium]